MSQPYSLGKAMFIRLPKRWQGVVRVVALDVVGWRAVVNRSRRCSQEDVGGPRACIKPLAQGWRGAYDCAAWCMLDTITLLRAAGRNRHRNSENGSPAHVLNGHEPQRPLGATLDGGAPIGAFRVLCGNGRRNGRSESWSAADAALLFEETAPFSR